jgi:hypothetical protein
MQYNNSLNQTKDTEIKWTIDAAHTLARPKWSETKLMSDFAGSSNKMKEHWDYVDERDFGSQSMK